MSKQVEFRYGALSDSLEEQAKKQGFTLGNNAERLQAICNAMIMCWIHGLVTDSQKDMMMKKMQKMVIKDLKQIK